MTCTVEEAMEELHISYNRLKARTLRNNCPNCDRKGGFTSCGGPNILECYFCGFTLEVSEEYSDLLPPSNDYFPENTDEENQGFVGDVDNFTGNN